jgi:acetyl-CoA C-acetyltransferase
MSGRVAVCAVAQIKNEPDIWYQRFQGMLSGCFDSIIAQTGVTFDMEKGIRSIVTCSDDVFDARTISDAAMTDVVGAHFRGEEKAAQDGINGLGYAMASILSGHDDIVLLMGHCKESQSESRNMCTNLAFDPFFCRPLGMDFLNASAFQARAYMEKSGVTDAHLAKIVARSRQKAAKNPYARANELVSEQDVLNSAMISDPIRELHQYPVTDWAVGMLLCCEERAKEFSDNPVYLTGFGSCMDSYFLGDKDLTSNFALKKASNRAFKMAGIGNPKNDIDLFELNDAVAYQLPMWAEGLGLVDEGKGGDWIDAGGMDNNNVNLSGGMLNGNPIMLGGIARALECVLQLKGEAGERQADGLSKALAHGTTGGAGQHHGVIILEK